MQIQVAYLHTLGADEARSRLSDFFAYESLVGDFQDLEWDWTGINTAQVSFKLYGLLFTGTVQVLSTEVNVASNIPLMARPFKSQIEASLRDMLAKALEKKYGRNSEADRKGSGG